jgi:transcription elongation GreA/GreB family factor
MILQQDAMLSHQANRSREVVDPEAPRARQPVVRAFFGATVRYANAAGEERVASIVGTRRGRSQP